MLLLLLKVSCNPPPLPAHVLMLLIRTYAHPKGHGTQRKMRAPGTNIPNTNLLFRQKSLCCEAKKSEGGRGRGKREKHQPFWHELLEARTRPHNSRLKQRSTRPCSTSFCLSVCSGVECTRTRVRPPYNSPRESGRHACRQIAMMIGKSKRRHEPLIANMALHLSHGAPPRVNFKLQLMRCLVQSIE
jgi:hypothetical protein